MRTKVKLDKAGRIALPKVLREQMHLAPGDILRLESDAKSITLRPVTPKAALNKELGIGVYRGAATNFSIPNLLDRLTLRSLLAASGGPRFENLAPKRGKLRCRRPVNLA
jgi:AbrB family looped-hinge helix DNA binding protein